MVNWNDIPYTGTVLYKFFGPVPTGTCRDLGEQSPLVLNAGGVVKVIEKLKPPYVRVSFISIGYPDSLIPYVGHQFETDTQCLHPYPC